MVFIGARRRPKEKDNEAFAKGVDPAVRSGRHIRLGCCPQSSRSGRRTDSVVPTQERLELLSNLVPHTFQQIALTSKVTKVTLSNRGARIDSFRGRPIAGPYFLPQSFSTRNLYWWLGSPDAPCLSVSGGDFPSSFTSGMSGLSVERYCTMMDTRLFEASSGSLG